MFLHANRNSRFYHATTAWLILVGSLPILLHRRDYNTYNKHGLKTCFRRYQVFIIRQGHLLHVLSNIRILVSNVLGLPRVSPQVIQLHCWLFQPFGIFPVRSVQHCWLAPDKFQVFISHTYLQQLLELIVGCITNYQSPGKRYFYWEHLECQELFHHQHCTPCLFLGTSDFS